MHALIFIVFSPIVLFDFDFFTVPDLDKLLFTFDFTFPILTIGIDKDEDLWPRPLSTKGEAD